MYVYAPNKTAEKFPYSMGDLKKDNPNTSFPQNPSLEILAMFSVYPVVSTSAPDYDPITQVVTQDGCLYNAERQRWETTWAIRDLTTEEKRARIPNIVTMRQGRLAMLQTPYGETNLLAMVDLALAAIQDPIQRQAAQIDWEFASEIRRDFPLVQQLSSALGLTEEQLDDLFKLAATL